MNAELSPAQVLALYPPHADTIASLLRTRAAVNPDKVCLQFEERVWTYAGLEKAGSALAQVLAARGLRKGERIALVSTNSDLSVLVLLAAARLGALFIPLNPAASDEELTYLLGHSRAVAVLCQPPQLARVTAICASRQPHAWVLSLDCLGFAAADADSVLERIEALAVAPAAALEEPRPDDPAIVIYTSGTTGFPKGVVHSQRNYVLAAEAFVARMHLQPAERLLTTLPFFHINALFYSLGGALAAGGTLIVARSFSASRFWNFAAQTGATQFNFLAAVGNILCNRPRSEFNAAHCIRKIYGGPISAQMFSVFQQEFAVPILLEGYGMSEIPGACCNPYAGVQKPGSIGLPAVHPRFPGNFAHMRIEDDAGRVLAAGEVGELLVRTPMMFKGYLDDPQQTQAAFRDGWFLTGDLARMDADGYFYFVARKKDIIRRRGENISGAELDRVFGEHPQVAEAAAIGVPSELGEEEILLVVVPREAGQLRPQDLVEWCQGRLAPMKVPRFIVFADSLPHTPSHRVAKHRLKADAPLLARALDMQPGRG